MAAQPFLVHSTPPVRGHALAAYHPLYTWANGERVRNPKFDAHSQHILNLKDDSKPYYFDSAAKYCAIQLHAFLKNVKLDQAEIVIVPSSTAGKVSPGLDKIVQAVCRNDKRLSYRKNSLHRTNTIAKLAKGGDRCIDVHLQSMDYKGVAGSPGLKIILDDVTTSGNSLAAAITVIQQHMTGLSFLAVVLGKTANDSF